jgi:CheY-like chemotaxis protein
LKVLVADDHVANRHLAAAILTKRGHTCVEAADGDQALRAIADEAFDVLLLDVQMPGRDGFAVTAAIRAAERTTGHHLPIVALTAHAMAGDRERCLAAGMDAYLAKPLRPGELVEVVEQVGGATGSRTGSSASSAGQVLPEGSAVDFTAALASMDNDIDLLLEQMAFFVNDAPSLLAEIRRAIETEDGTSLGLHAHRLKGLVARYRDETASQLAQQLESLASRRQLHAAQPIYDQLVARVKRLVAAIGQYIDHQERGNAWYADP